jgi:hypothetical protein
MKNYIYTLSDDSGNIRYIGKTKNPKKREKEHIYFSGCERRRSLLDCWKIKMKKEKRKIYFEILDETNYDINFLEKYWISQFKCWNFNLLNMTEGGDGLQNPSKEIREKIGLKSKGRISSKKTREKISEKNYNKKGKEIICYDINKNLIGEFRNARRASEFTGVSFKKISKICNNKAYFLRNYTFFFKSDGDIQTTLNERILNTKKQNQKIYGINEKNNERIDFNSQAEAADFLKINFRNISLCLKNKRKTAGGFKWYIKK